MAGSDAFRDALKTAVDQEVTAGYQRAYNKLKSIAKSIEETVSGEPGKAQVVIKPGYRINAGQQLRVVIRFPLRDYETTMFRAYIPTNGFPVSFDFYGEQMTQAQDEAQMDQMALDFLTRPEMATQIRSFQELASE